MTAPKASRQRVAVNSRLYSSDCVRTEPERAPWDEPVARDLLAAEALERRGAADIRVHFDTGSRKPPRPGPWRRKRSLLALATTVPTVQLRYALKACDELAEALAASFEIDKLIEAGAGG